MDSSELPDLQAIDRGLKDFQQRTAIGLLGNDGRVESARLGQPNEDVAKLYRTAKP